MTVEDPAVLSAAVAGGDRSARRRWDDAVDAAHREDERVRLSAHLDSLAAEAAAGSGGALEALLAAVARLRLAEAAIRRVLLDPNDVDDAVQVTLVKVSLHIDSYRRDARFTSWLHTVAQNEARMLVRGRSRQQARDDRVHREDVGAERRMSSLVADRAALRDIVDAMPAAHRDVLLLREWEGKDYEEIASTLGVPVGTVRSRLSRARQELDRQVLASFRARREESDG